MVNKWTDKDTVLITREEQVSLISLKSELAQKKQLLTSKQLLCNILSSEITKLTTKIETLELDSKRPTE